MLQQIQWDNCSNLAVKYTQIEFYVYLNLGDHCWSFDTCKSISTVTADAFASDVGCGILDGYVSSNSALSGPTNRQIYHTNTLYFAFFPYYSIVGRPRIDIMLHHDHDPTSSPSVVSSVPFKRVQPVFILDRV